MQRSLTHTVLSSEEQLRLANESVAKLTEEVKGLRETMTYSRAGPGGQ